MPGRPDVIGRFPEADACSSWSAADFSHSDASVERQGVVDILRAAGTESAQAVLLALDGKWDEGNVIARSATPFRT